MARAALALLAEAALAARVLAAAASLRAVRGHQPSATQHPHEGGRGCPSRLGLGQEAGQGIQPVSVHHSVLPSRRQKTGAQHTPLALLAVPEEQPFLPLRRHSKRARIAGCPCRTVLAEPWPGSDVCRTGPDAGAVAIRVFVALADTHSAIRQYTENGELDSCGARRRLEPSLSPCFGS